MKITDVSSAPIISTESQDERGDNVRTEAKRQQTLLQRYNIPIEHLDFAYVDKCTDTREIERILRILRSGEEGSFPDLERFVVTQLEKLNPNSCLLRVETPVLHTNALDKDERESIQTSLDDWLNEVTAKSSKPNSSSEIFTVDCAEESEPDPLKNFPLPVRGSVLSSVVEERKRHNVPTSTDHTEGEARIKSWEYDKWDRYDVDAELTKMDIVDMQREEWERREKPKVIEEQKRIEKLMKDTGDDGAQDKFTGKSSNTTGVTTKETREGTKLNTTESQNRFKKDSKQRVGSTQMPVEKPSYVEELSDDDEEGVVVNASAVFAGHGHRRATVVIEDLNLTM